jgi:hypothetical protein
MPPTDEHSSRREQRLAEGVGVLFCHIALGKWLARLLAKRRVRTEHGRDTIASKQLKLDHWPIAVYAVVALSFITPNSYWRQQQRGRGRNKAMVEATLVQHPAAPPVLLVPSLH